MIRKRLSPAVALVSYMFAHLAMMPHVHGDGMSAHSDERPHVHFSYSHGPAHTHDVAMDHVHGTVGHPEDEDPGRSTKSRAQWEGVDHDDDAVYLTCAVYATRAVVRHLNLKCDALSPYVVDARVVSVSALGRAYPAQTGSYVLHAPCPRYLALRTLLI